MIFDFQHGITFCHNPKCGGQTIRNHVKCHAQLVLDLWGIWSEHSTIAPKGDLAHLPMRFADAFVSRSFLDRSIKFAVVRDPVDRVHSAWAWLVANRGLKIDLNSFVGRLESLEYPHVQRQVYYLCDENHRLLVDRVLRFENFQEEINNLLDELGIARCSRRDGVSRRTSFYREEFTSRSIDTLGAFYADDFRMFGYRL